MTKLSISRASLVVATLLLGLAPVAQAQSARLTLAEALKLAAEHSEGLDIARAGETRADADVLRTNSQRLPQVNLASSYTRTLASEFSGISASGPVCAPLSVDASKPVADRVSELERAAGCGGLGSSFSFAKLPFGQRNVYQATLSFSQTLYTGGRITAQQAQAALGGRAARLTTSATEAQLKLDVTRAYYDAALTDRMVAIAELGYDQAAAASAQARLAFDAGRQPEFELLRAEVARDNQRPAVIRRRADRDIAYLRLRQLLELAPDAPLELDVDLDLPGLPPPAPFVEALASAAVAPAASPAEAARVSVQQSETVVGLREASVTVAHAARRPSLSLGSTLGRVGYPSDGVFPGVGDFRTNWSLAATLQMSLFNGGRLRADEVSARADVAEAQARLKQTKELAVLDAATVRQDLGAAQAAWEATAGAIQQAERAYQIAELRSREGLSTQLELSDSRLSLQVAQANRAVAAHDLQIARAHLALLPNLPVGTR